MLGLVRRAVDRRPRGLAFRRRWLWPDALRCPGPAAGRLSRSGRRGARHRRRLFLIGADAGGGRAHGALGPGHPVGDRRRGARRCVRRPSASSARGRSCAATTSGPPRSCCASPRSCRGRLLRPLRTASTSRPTSRSTRLRSPGPPAAPPVTGSRSRPPYALSPGVLRHHRRVPRGDRDARVDEDELPLEEFTPYFTSASVRWRELTHHQARDGSWTSSRAAGPLVTAVRGRDPASRRP